jgi:hypothetical protein
MIAGPCKLGVDTSLVDIIETIQEKCLRLRGKPCLNVSHWDPSEEFTAPLLTALQIPNHASPVPYVFSYQVSDWEKILQALGFDPAFYELLFTPSGSVSILCVANWLAAMEAREIQVLCPAYFSLFHNCSRLRIDAKKTYLKRTQRPGNGSTEYTPPDSDNGQWKKPGVLWVTNPVYCTGIYLNEETIAWVKDLLERGWYVIADECLAVDGRELGRQIGCHPRFLGIYAPHKTICLNGIKFSALVIPRPFEPFFDSWEDALYGSLASSTCTGIRHYLSPNFRHYQSVFSKRLDQPRRFLIETCKRFPRASLDRGFTGYYATCHFPHLSHSLGRDAAFLMDVAEKTDSVFIPGNHNYFDPALGLNFRINLTRDSAEFRRTIACLVEHLSSCNRNSHEKASAKKP